MHPPESLRAFPLLSLRGKGDASHAAGRPLLAGLICAAQRGKTRTQVKELRDNQGIWS